MTDDGIRLTTDTSKPKTLMTLALSDDEVLDLARVLGMSTVAPSTATIASFVLAEHDLADQIVWQRQAARR